jgi:hypothetical protein
MDNEEIIATLIAILKPLKGTGEPSHDEDTFLIDEPIRKVVLAALKELKVEGLGGCPLCAS